MMKAIVVPEPGPPETLTLQQVPDPELRAGYVMLDVKATALNRADLLQRRGLYPPPRGETDIMGLECAGVVAEVPPDVSGIETGARVAALLPGGGYAERVAIPARMAIPLPDTLSFEEGAAIPEAFLTAREALFGLGQLGPGQTVLIHASAGGVGSAAVQLAHDHGATVVATAGSNVKLEKVKQLGADVVVNYRDQDFAEVVVERTNGKGVDVILDFIGGSYWEKHERCLATGGRCVVIGVMGGMTAEVNLALLLRKRHQLLGLVMRSRPVSDKVAMTQSFIRESLPRFEDGRLRPIIDRVFPLAEAGRAHAYMEENQNFGKIVLSV
jgi:putative PIG3 family NAD(P)H quinone oxidoreductase